MPPPGGVRLSLSANYTSDAWNAAFQPSTGTFSPGLPPIPAREQAVRLLDFHVGQNTLVRPRVAELLSFWELRRYANVELIRLAIETRKDQIERLDWQIKPKYQKRSGARGDDARIKTLETFFRKPDGEHHFSTWLRLLLEDLLVIDAPTLEKRRNYRGCLIGLDVVQGDTIKLLVDETGRRPVAPLPAYQQIIKGVLWNDLTTTDLLYRPRNPRPGKLYGFSPTEQIVVTINTIIARQTSQLGYFSEGNIPSGILNAPDGWGPDAIKTMQDAWDLRTQNDPTNSKKLRWVPKDTKYQAFKEPPLKDDFDEWLARIVAFAFSLPPTPFIKQMNRSTSESDQDRALEEGLEPIKLWAKRLIDDVIQEEFGFVDLEFAWNDTPSIDPKVQADVDDKNLRNGSATIDEVRDGRGLEPLPNGQGATPLLYVSAGAVTLEQVLHASEEALNPPEPLQMQPTQPDGQEGSESGAAEVEADTEGKPKDPKAPKAAPAPKEENEPYAEAEKLAKADVAVTADRPKVKRAINRMTKTLSAALEQTGLDVASEVEKKLESMGKADDASQDFSTEEGQAKVATVLADAADLSALADTANDLYTELYSVAYNSAAEGIAHIGVADAASLVNQVSAPAISWAQTRAAQLVATGGEKNIMDPTRTAIRDVITQGLKDNIGAAKIADNIQAATAFSPARAELIAQTELRFANSWGALLGAQAAQETYGLNFEKAWLTSTFSPCCDVCGENADEGYIPLLEAFPSGDQTTPAHPRCHCSVTMRVIKDEDSE